MIDVVLSELPIVLYDLLPDEEYFAFCPMVVSGLFPILNDIQQTALIVLEYHNEGIESASAHYKVVEQL